MKEYLAILDALSRDTQATNECLIEENHFIASGGNKKSSGPCFIHKAKENAVLVIVEENNI